MVILFVSTLFQLLRKRIKLHPGCSLYVRVTVEARAYWYARVLGVYHASV